MNIQEVRSIAKEHGIKTSRLSKTQLIQTIQLSEGNFDCFASALDGTCDQAGCLWRDDCFVTAKKLKN